MLGRRANGIREDTPTTYIIPLLASPLYSAKQMTAL